MSHFWFLFLFKQSKYPLSLKLVLNCVVTIHLQYFSSFRELCIALSRAGILYWFTYFFHYDMRVNKGRGRLSKWGVRACPKLVAHIYPGGLPLDLPIDKSNFPFWNMKRSWVFFAPPPTSKRVLLGTCCGCCNYRYIYTTLLVRVHSSGCPS